MDDPSVPRPTRGDVLAVAIFVNSLCVKMFDDSTLYTALKNGVVGIVLLAILSLAPRVGIAVGMITVVKEG